MGEPAPHGWEGHDEDRGSEIVYSCESGFLTRDECELLVDVRKRTEYGEHRVRDLEAEAKRYMMHLMFMRKEEENYGYADDEYPDWEDPIMINGPEPNPPAA